MLSWKSGRRGPEQILAAALVALTLAGCGKALTSGNATLALSQDSKTLTFSRGDETLLTFGTDAFQLGTTADLTTGSPSFDPFWLSNTAAQQPPGLKWRQLPAGGTMKLLSLTSKEMKLQINYTGASATVTFAVEPEGISALMTAQVTDGQQIGFMRLRPHANDQEGFYGLGEWGDSVDHRGKYRAMQMETANLESGDTEDHTPVPLLVGTRGWGLFVESKRPGAFDVATQDATTIEITYGTAEQSAQGLAFHLFSEPQPLDIFKHYYDLTGYPRLPSTWALGPMLWRDATTESQMLGDVAQIRSIPLATSGMWFDRPYATGVETFDFNPANFSDPAMLFQTLHDNGLRYAIWQAPYEAAAGNGEDPAPVQNMYATENHFFPPTTGLLVNQWSKPIDFTNADAYAWWQTQLMAYVNDGVEGFKLDYGEDIENGIDGVRDVWDFSDGSDERTMHYGYTLLYHKAYSELLPKEGGFFLCRTGRWGDQIHGMIIWPGDLDSDLSQQGDTRSDGTLAVGGLPAALMKGISLSASGFPFFASDTGGYRHSPATNETYIRWTEASALGTAMETGDSNSAMPWEYAQWGRTADSLTQYQRYASLHLRLFPYEWSYAIGIASTGRPIERPFALAYPSLGQNPNDEYLFGDSILVAPVVTAGATSRTLFLPPGTWYGWWDGSAQNGGQNGTSITVPADIDTLPLFIEAGGIVPMLRDTIQTMAPVAAGSTVDSFATDAGVLSVRVAPGPAKTQFTLYDGTSITQQPDGAHPSITFTPGQSAVFVKGALFEIIATPQPSDVSANGAALTQAASSSELTGSASGWAWNSATGGTLWVKVPGAATIAIK